MICRAFLQKQGRNDLLLWAPLHRQEALEDHIGRTDRLISAYGKNDFPYGNNKFATKQPRSNKERFVILACKKGSTFILNEQSFSSKRIFSVVYLTERKNWKYKEISNRAPMMIFLMLL